jgi:thiol:disulfide interchange protein DsbA
MSQSKLLESSLTRRQLLGAGAAAGATLALGALVPHTARAQNTPKDGRDYTTLSAPQITDKPGKIEVIEFFGFWCPHCNEFEPVLETWVKKQPADVSMRFVPVAFTDSQVPLQRLFYTLKYLGKEEALRTKVFAAIHVTHTPLDNAEQQADWAASNGVDRKKYLDFYNSFSVNQDVHNATRLATDIYTISSIPTLAVNGKYTVLGGPETLGTVDYLIAKERRGGK